MNIVKATRRYEEWLRQHIRVVEPDLQFKHTSRWPRLFSRFFAPPSIAGCKFGPRSAPIWTAFPVSCPWAILHVENFGTWRDTDGRLVWGVNDFDEAFVYPTLWIWCAWQPARCSPLAPSISP
jgi:hypothetical protein